MNAHWQNGHKEYHKVQKERAKDMLEGGLPERTRSLAEAVARRAERTGNEFDKRFAAAAALTAEGDLNAAVKAWRKLIKQWPNKPEPYFNLAVVLQRSNHSAEAAPMYLKAMELHEDGTEDWAVAASGVFDLLKSPACDEVPKPEWWNDEELKTLSARVVAVAPERPHLCAMRARVLEGDALYKASWNAGPRTAAEIKGAATWYRRAARVSVTPVDMQRDKQRASACDAYADPLLAEEKAEVEKARAAAKAEAAEALKVAEAKATAAAEELLAEEAKEQKKAATSTTASKAKGKGKKGKGKR